MTRDTHIFQDTPQAVTLEIPDEITNTLPQDFGYSEEHFASDLLSAFGENPERKHVRDVVDDWQVQGIKDGTGQNHGLWRTKEVAAKGARGFSRLSHHPLKQQLLEATGGDRQAAAQAMLNIMARRIANGKGGGMGGAFDALNNTVAPGKGLDGLPFGPFGGGDGGDHSPELLANAFRVNEILRKLRVRYQPYAKRSIGQEEVPYPDDLDTQRLRSFAPRDLANICTMDQVRDDEDFYARLVRKELSQTVFVTPKPGPPLTFVMLLDVSSSMGETVGDTGYSRAEFAAASAIALLESSLKGGHKCVLIRFDGQPKPPIEGTPAEVVREVLRCLTSGGSTDIDRAIEAAAEHKPDEIILVTDGTEVVTVTPRCPMVTYQCGQGEKQSIESMRRRSRLYQQVEEGLVF